MVMGRKFRFLFFTPDADHEWNWARDGMAPSDIARGTDAVEPDRDFRLGCIKGKIKGLRGYEWAQERRAEDLTELTGSGHLHVGVLPRRSNSSNTQSAMFLKIGRGPICRSTFARL